MPDSPLRQSKRCGCPDCNPGGGYECLNTEMRDERDRYRATLERIAYPDSREMAILDEASDAAREALDG